MADTITITVSDDEGFERELELAARVVKCHRCDGKGVHDNPAFENGISPDEFSDDPDFRDGYFAGHFDVTCSECHGRRVVKEIDRTAITPDERAAIALYDASERDAAEERAHERRMRSLGIEY